MTTVKCGVQLAKVSSYYSMDIQMEKSKILEGNKRKGEIRETENESKKKTKMRGKKMV